MSVFLNADGSRYLSDYDGERICWDRAAVEYLLALSVTELVKLLSSRDLYCVLVDKVKDNDFNSYFMLDLYLDRYMEIVHERLASSN